MANEIPDLWGNTINVNVLTPISVLNTQVELLKQKTKGTVHGELTGRQVGDLLTIAMDLRAPAVLGFRSRILYVRHSIEEVYPALVPASALRMHKDSGSYSGKLAWGNQDDSLSVLAYTQEQLIALLKVALQSPIVQSQIQSLIAKSNEIHH